MHTITKFPPDTIWRVGISSIKITPEKSMWMAGYASRTAASNGKVHDLWAKALVMDDAEGNRAVLVTMDILGVPKGLSDEIRGQLELKYQLTRAQINLNSSHTHSGPVLKNALTGIYPLEAEDHTAISDYSKQFVEKVVELVGLALTNLQPAYIFAGNGVDRFLVNRRSNSEADLNAETELKGPHDYSVPVLKVESPSGELLAVAFGYACHNTVLDINQWSGDYAGFAQIELEKEYPGITALFFQGAAGDINPLPRRTIPLAKQYGRSLASAVTRVLEEDMRVLPARLFTAYSEFDLELEAPSSERDLLDMIAASAGFEARCAQALLTRLRSGELFELTYKYPVQFWSMGGQPIVALGGEAVIEYALELKKILGNNLFVMAYSNDVMGYIPSETILAEGGYEGDSSQMVYGLPGKWKKGIQQQIISEVKKLSGEICSATGIKEQSLNN